MKGWTSASVKKFLEKDPVVPTLKTKKRSEGKKALKWITNVLDDYGIEYKYETKFTKTRNWRFDIFIPNFNIAVEYEGLVSEKSRHTTLTGFTGDAQKYNLGQIKGIKILRYTILSYKDFELDFLRILVNLKK